MNVRCQSCETVYRIDPLKVPVEGVHARCTVCSAVIPIERVTEENAPATDRPMTPHALTTEDRVAHALGDAFIPAPAEDEAIVGDMDMTVPEMSEETREAERTSERQAVESMPGIIMPPSEDDLDEEPASPAVSGSVESVPDVDAESDTVPIEPITPRVSRPFVPPSDLPFARPTLEPVEPRIRPTAPVFRPTPGQPPRTPIAAPPPLSSSPSVTPPVKPFRPSVRPPVTAPASTPTPPVSAPTPPVSAPTPPVSAPTPPVSTPTPPVSTPTPPMATPPSVGPAATVSPIEPVPPVPSPSASSDASAPAPLTRPVNPFLSKNPGQRARRLARALISDMIVYQPEKRQKALEDGTLADAFDEEIKKSWQEYVDQVGEDQANSTSYFNDALNDLLADGEKMF